MAEPGRAATVPVDEMPLGGRPVGMQLWSLAGALMLLLDESNRIVAANPALCAAVGLAEVELIGRDAADLVVPREVAEFRHELRVTSRSGVQSTYEHALRTGHRRRAPRGRLVYVVHV